ncbi:creatine kinase M-type-like, partial [Entelurus aequoreus]|uniref:creatine kinase M-type-like n=1 Tax=Entelurus aequoreus TaxID=161455 RepID=UPI002B1D0E63
TAKDEFPDLSQHNNHMAKVLTLEMYKKLKDRTSPNGFTIDDVIQTGVDNPGNPLIRTVGCVAGDEESYVVFRDLLNLVIAAKHKGFKPKDKLCNKDIRQIRLTDKNNCKLGVCVSCFP